VRNPISGDDERLSAWILAISAHPPLRDRLAAIREEGSFAGALGRLYGSVSSGTWTRAEAALSRLERRGDRLLVLGSSDYPALLASIADPPIALTVRGSLLREDQLGIAIVGSRRATGYGRDVARRLSRDLSASGLTITSGLARGIDACAHEGALDAKGRTLAVLGSGLENLYPREHRRLADRIVESGALISEFALDEPPLPSNFPRRNRVITGLSLGTLVVEAAAKSGSLVSARLALEQNREVFAVPGPVSSPTSEGVHALIRDGARLVEKAADVLEELRSEVRDALVERRRATSSTGTPSASDLDPEARSVLAELLSTEEGLDLDRILARLPLRIERALAALCRLELEGLVAALPGGLYRARRD
jgi:DNA processing protein